jgi:hypothetical protein
LTLKLVYRSDPNCRQRSLQPSYLQIEWSHNQEIIAGDLARCLSRQFDNVLAEFLHKLRNCFHLLQAFVGVSLVAYRNEQQSAFAIDPATNSLAEANPTF